MKVVFTAAVMDLCHKGHLNLLKAMKKEGDKVVVVLHDDKSIYETKGKIPIQSLSQRIENLKITGLVDDIRVTYSHEPIKEFNQILEDYKSETLIFMRGNDWKQFPGRSVLDANNITIKFVPYTKGVSSTKIRKKLEKYG